MLTDLKCFQEECNVHNIGSVYNQHVYVDLIAHCNDIC